MGMNLKRAIKLQGEYVSRLVDLFSSAEIYSYSSDEFLAAKKRFYESLPKALPQHVRAFIDGYESALFKPTPERIAEYQQEGPHAPYTQSLFYRYPELKP